MTVMSFASRMMLACGGSGLALSTHTSSMRPAEILRQRSGTGFRPLPSISVPLTMYSGIRPEETQQRGVELLVLLVVRRMRRALELHEAAARQQLRRRFAYRERHHLVLIAPGEQHRKVRRGELLADHVVVQPFGDVPAERGEGLLRARRVVDAELG